MPNSVCIYCRQTKVRSAFNREHVIPQAFGRFKENLVLHGCVCQACNSAFGQHLDEVLALDSVEGFERYHRGLRNPLQFRSLGERSRTKVRVTAEGPLHGADVWLTAPPRDLPQLGLVVPAQIGLSRTQEGPFQWFHRESMPSLEQLFAMGYERGADLHLRFRSMDESEALALLKSRGLDNIRDLEPAPTEEGEIQTEITFKIDGPVVRALCKIALNYVCRVASAAMALDPAFDDIREFVRSGQKPPGEYLHVDESPHALQHDTAGRAVRGHYVALEPSEFGVLAELSLFCRLRYQIRLSSSVPTRWTVASSAHFFDPEEHLVRTILPRPANQLNE